MSNHVTLAWGDCMAVVSDARGMRVEYLDDRPDLPVTLAGGEYVIDGAHYASLASIVNTLDVPS